MRRGLTSIAVLAFTTQSACDFFAPDDELLGYRGKPNGATPAAGTTEAVGMNGAGDPNAPGGSDGGAKLADGAPAPTPTSPTPAPTAKLAEKLAITEVAIFQGVKVSIAKSGAKVTSRTMPVVAGRDALLRVYVTPDAGFNPHDITAELHIVRGGQGLPIATATATISGPSSEGSPTTTFNFEIPGSTLTPDASYFVQLLDDGAPGVPSATANAAQYPNVAAAESLDAQSGADSLKVVVVPMQYGADGSNRVPDTGATMLEALRKRTLELYPVPAVDITVHAPVPFGSAIAPDGTGWDTVLGAVRQLRIQEAPAADVYYYGVFAPSATASAYCPASCVLGLSTLASSLTDASQRASVGVLYNNNEVILTMPHELGHAHGRKHAPCGNAAGPDPTFPYPDATIGVWGYSIVTKLLFSPSGSAQPHDFMSYCGPEWTSDYTFQALFERGQTLKTANMRSLTQRSAPLVRRPLRFVFERPSGLSWQAGQAVWSTEPLAGEEHAVSFLDAGGNVIGRDTAHRYPYDHLSGSYLIVPDAPAGTSQVVIDGVGTLPKP
jgi:hypothetical protein